jgi:hypothetical protein
MAISQKLLISIKVYEESEDCGLTSCEQLLVARRGRIDFSTPLYQMGVRDDATNVVSSAECKIV